MSSESSDVATTIQNAGFSQGLKTWLDALATQPLPGGVAAAAVSAAMGAALVAKATQVTLQRQSLTESNRTALETALGLARTQQAKLVHLAHADEIAYRALLDSPSPEGLPRTRDKLWQNATQVPISVAESCHTLLNSLSEVSKTCRPAVKPDLEVGCWLLEVGLNAGLSAAKSNLQSWGANPESRRFHAKLEMLTRGRDSRPQQPGAGENL